MKRLITLITFSLIPLIVFSQKFDIQHWQTHSGAKVLFVKQTELPMVDITVAFKAGSAYEEQHWGLAMLTANLMEQGANGKSATQIAEQFENYGALFSIDVDRDKAVFSLRTLTHKDTLQHVIEALSQILSQPDFKPSDIQREKNQQLTLIQYQNEKPGYLASASFYKTLYQNHPYGHPVLGTKNTVTKLTREQVVSFYKSNYHADNATISIVGNLSTNDARSLTENLSKLFKSNNLPAKPLPDTSLTKPLKTKQLIKFPSNQTTIMLGQLGITRQNPDFFPLIVGNYILGGGGLVSRLSVEVREKRGLTYGVSSSFKLLSSPAPFSINLATKNSQAEEALDITLKTIEQFIQLGPNDKELTAAKQYLIGSFPLQFSSNKNLASILVNMGIYNLPLDYLDTYLLKVEKVGKENIKSAFQKTIRPNQFVTVMVGRE